MKKKYIKISIASPKKILFWSERNLPNGNLVGKINKPLRHYRKNNGLVL